MLSLPRPLARTLNVVIVTTLAFSCCLSVSITSQSQVAEVCACLAVETMGLPLVGSESEPGEMRLFQVSENGLVRLSATRPLAVNRQSPV